MKTKKQIIEKVIGGVGSCTSQRIAANGGTAGILAGTVKVTKDGRLAPDEIYLSIETSSGDTCTVYLTPKQAAQLSSALDYPSDVAAW